MTATPKINPVDLASRLAIQRTRQAADRTLMAWMRTATSMISFGFSIGKLFEMETVKATLEAAPIPFIDHGPFAVGSLLVALAILFLIAASIEYQLILRRLGRENGQALGMSTAQIAAIAITLLGMVALTSLFWRF